MIDITFSMIQEIILESKKNIVRGIICIETKGKNSRLFMIQEIKFNFKDLLLETQTRSLRKKGHKTKK